MSIPERRISRVEKVNENTFDIIWEDEDLPKDESSPSPVQTNNDFRGKVIDRGDTGDEILSKINFKPTPNPMSELDRPTYYIKFSLLSDDGQSGESIILETGYTNLNIKDMRIESYIGPNFITKNTNATKITLTVFEPQSASLPDLLFRSAIALGVKNYQKCKWRLYLKLHGRDENGNTVDNVGNRDWTYDVTILDIKSNITSNGSMHTIELVPINELSLSNEFELLSDGVSLEGETIGDIVSSLKDKLNSDIMKKYGFQFIEYDFKDEPYSNEFVSSSVVSPFGHKLTSDKPQENQSRNSQGAQVSKGTSVFLFVDSLFSQSDSAVKIAAGIDDLVSPNPSYNNPISVIHRIKTDIQLLDYSTEYNDYLKKITFTIYPYYSFRVVPSIKAASDVQTIETNLKKANFAYNIGCLKKQYDYIFTGMNTEVINFDINVNFRWQVASSLLQGLIHSQMASMPRAYNEIARERLRTTADADIKQQINNELDLIKRGEGDINRLRALQQENANIEMSRQPGSTVRLESSKNVYYADDLLSETKPLTDVFPITIYQDANDPRYRTQLNTDSHWNRGKTVYGILLNQLYSYMDDNLQNLQLDIKGDPYWIGSTNTDEYTTQQQSINSQEANYSLGEQVAVLRIKLPQGIDEETGIVKLSDSDTFSGFFNIYKVDHVFEDGIFKQTLHGARIPGWEISKLIN